MAQLGPPQIWHHRIHQRWAGEDLTFWRLVFFPKYDRDKILRIIKSVMASEGVHAFAIYEAMGLFDLFLRAWLPNHTSEKLERSLGDALESESLQLLDSFSVTRVLRHHAWEASSGPLDPKEDVLAEPLSDSVIERLNEGLIPPDEQQELLKKRILARVSPGGGVQFLTIISSALFSMTNEAQTSMREGLLKRIRESSVCEPAVYEGSGFGQYLITGRANGDNFSSITELSTAINKLVLESGVLARPYTHIFAHRIPLFYVDRLPLLEVDRSCDVGVLLREGATHTLETRVGLAVGLAGWLDEDSVDVAMSEQLINNGVIKTVVGMLNADGGRILLGVVERNAKVDGIPVVEHPKFAGLPERGAYICVGINGEYGEGGWDEFRSKVSSLLASKIQPPPSGSVSVSREVVEEGIEVCVISAQPTRATWFYRVLTDTGPVNFFVREGDRTVSYAGVEADVYKRQRPRG